MSHKKDAMLKLVKARIFYDSCHVIDLACNIIKSNMGKCYKFVLYHSFSLTVTDYICLELLLPNILASSDSYHEYFLQKAPNG